MTEGGEGRGGEERAGEESINHTMVILNIAVRKIIDTIMGLSITHPLNTAPAK